MTIGTLPTNGLVTLGDGATPVLTGQILTPAQLGVLLFTPGAGQSGVSSPLAYTVTDPAGGSATGSVAITVGPQVSAPTPTLSADSPSGVTATQAITNLANQTFSGTALPRQHRHPLGRGRPSRHHRRHCRHGGLRRHQQPWRRAATASPRRTRPRRCSARLPPLRWDCS